MEGNTPIEKRRLPGACDICRGKKKKCDSARMPDNICSNCVTHGLRCTRIHASEGKAKSTTSQPRLRKSMSHKIFDDFAPTRAKVAAISGSHYALPEDKAATQLILVELATYVQALELALSSTGGTVGSPSPSPKRNLPQDQTPNDGQNETPKDETPIEDQFQILNLSDSHPRFFGKSSNMLLVKAAIDMRKQAFGDAHLDAENTSVDSTNFEYWFGDHYPHKYLDEDDVPLTFPDPALMRDLIDLYFARFHTFLPIFHKPTFEKQLAEGLHLWDRQFGAVVLAVCALACRYSSSDCDKQSGWIWFSQVQRIQVLEPLAAASAPTLHIIQLYCVSALYLQGMCNKGVDWTLVGIAVRLLQDVGAHRKAPQGPARTVQSELWKRTFWAVITLDILISAALGRPRAANPDDYDQDLPTECDDEYWETVDPAVAFKQPPGTPSKISAHLSLLKLFNILGAAQRSIYTANKSDPLLNRYQSDVEAIVNIDSALNQWLDSVPEHVRWDPHKEDPIFFDQSAMLYSTYYYVQILVHKPFIPSSAHAQPVTPFPSIAICANAARSCTHVIDIQARRSFIPFPAIQMALLHSAVVLMLNHWNRPRMGLSGKHNTDIHKCINVLRLYDSRWKVTHRLIERLEQLVSSQHVQHSPPPNLKRYRQDDEDASVALPEAKKSAMVPGQHLYPLSTPALEQVFSLPFSTDELGRLPVHGTFDFSEDSWHPNPRQPSTDLTFSENLAASMIQSGLQTQTNIDYGMQELFSPWDTQTMELFNQAPHGYDWGDWMKYLYSMQEHMDPNGLMRT